MANLKVVTAQSAPRQKRRHRRPQLPFNVKFRPYEICPFMCHPVLANETLDNLLMQDYVYTDPIVNRGIGWHLHHEFYYAPMMAIANEYLQGGQGNSVLLPQDIADLHLGRIANMTNIAVSGANNPQCFEFKGSFPWLNYALTIILNKFYRDEDDFSVGGPFTDQAPSGLTYPLRYINQRSWIHSLKEESAGTDDAELPGVDPIEETDILAGYSTSHDQWEIMRDSGEEDLSYDDYLKAQGVRLGRGVQYEASLTAGISVEPELVRFSRKWAMPSMGAQPEDGSVTSIVKWNCAERADKKRYFREPGFLIGVMSVLPKLYLGNQKGSLVGAMTTADHWLPKVLQGFPYTSVKEILDSGTDGPLQNQDEDYWLDFRDLLMYGEEFRNQAGSVAENHGVAIPDGNPLNKRYLSDAEIKSFFTDAAGTAYNVHADGTVHLDILTSISDTTPGSGL